MDYLQLTLTTQQAIDRIAQAIKERKPYLLSRFGDGEIFCMMDKVPKHISAKWQGVCHTTDSVNHILRVVERRLRHSLSEADMIGILDPAQTNGTDVPYSEEAWSLPMRYVDRARAVRPQYEVCDHQIVRTPELGAPDNFKRLLKGQPVHIVSPSARLMKKQNLLPDLLGCEVSYTHVELETTNETYHTPSNLCYKIGFALYERPETKVVLFGTSAIGAYVGTYLRRQGCVALDYGSVLEGWAGIEARGTFATTQSHCLVKHEY